MRSLLGTFREKQKRTHLRKGAQSWARRRSGFNYTKVLDLTKLGPKPGLVTASPSAPPRAGRVRAQRFTDVAERGRAGRERRAGPSGLPRSPSSAGAPLSPGPSSRPSFLEETAAAESGRCYFPTLPYRRCGRGDKRDPEERAGSPQGTDPGAPPGPGQTVTAAPRVTGQPSDGATSKPRSGSHQCPGRRRRARCAAPGDPLPREARRRRPNQRRDRPGSRRWEDETLGPAGLCAQAAPRPLKGLWEM